MSAPAIRIRHLVAAEIRHRKLQAGLALLSVTVAVASLVGSLTALRAHDVKTARVLAQREEQTRAQMATLQDDYRKIMKVLGFNVLILPRAYCGVWVPSVVEVAERSEVVLLAQFPPR